MSRIPGYKSFAEFSRQTGVHPDTISRQMKQGYCAWPRIYKDNKKRHPLYSTWQGMKNRCLDKNSNNYHLYGARGIAICGRWNDFNNFLADMGPKPGPEYTLDRIDNDGNYELGNCRWATPEEQAANTRRLLGYVYHDKKYNSYRLFWRGKYIESNSDKEIIDKRLKQLRSKVYAT